MPTIDDDGLVLWESNAIVRYLAAKQAMGTLCPRDPGEHADADRWMDWQQTTILPFMTPIFWGLVRDPDGTPRAQIDAAIATGIECWRILDARLAGRDWIMGDTFTMAEIPLGPQARRCSSWSMTARQCRRSSLVRAAQGATRFRPSRDGDPDDISPGRD